MIKKQFISGITSLALITLIFLARFNNWPGNGKLIYLGIAILSILTIILTIRAKKQKLLLFITGLIWVVLIIVFSGICFKIMNWSNTAFWPISNLGKYWNKMDIDYQSFNWPISTPEKYDIKQSLIDEKLINKFEALHYPLSLLIIKNDSLITEKYFNGSNLNTAFNIASATKSVVSILVGIAIDKGLIKDENVSIKSLIPEYYTKKTGFEKDSITVKSLLTMQAGWDSNNGRNLKGYDWIASAMSNRLKFKPGSAFLYSDIEPHFLVHIIEKQSKLKVMEFANANLCRPLNITIANWLKSPNGKSMGGGPLFMTARDMARFGQLILKKGIIDGNTVVDSAWIKKMTNNYVQKSMMPEDVPAKGYGYLLWIDKYKNYEIWLVAGAGGQIIMIVPRLAMILVTTSSNNIPQQQLIGNALNIQKLLYDFVDTQIKK
jgi:CubicO group peptidase (beta-lactamase class C family)